MADETRKLNVFISYSRDDLAFADQLGAALKLTGFGTFIDRQGISAGEDWKNRLGSLIRDADTVVFVLSPSSARSATCRWEVAEAVRLGKRVLPVLCRSIEGADPPPQLAALNYIYFYDEPRFPGSGFGSGLVGLASALDTDLEWLREHTRYLQRALEWDAGGRAANRLLSGPDIEAAKAWAARRPKDAPEPTGLQLDFIKASEAEALRQQSAEAQLLKEMAEAQDERARALAEREEAQKREAEAQKGAVEARTREAKEARRVASRTRLGLGAAIVLALVATGFGLFANQQPKTADEQRKLAEQATTTAKIERDNAVTATEAAKAQRDRAELQESRALAIRAEEASAAGDQQTAMLLALEALPGPGFGGTRPMSFEAAAALHQAWLRNRETMALVHPAAVRFGSFIANGKKAVTVSEDGTARLWNLSESRPTSVELKEPDRDSVAKVDLDADGNHAVTVSSGHAVFVWDLRNDADELTRAFERDPKLANASSWASEQARYPGLVKYRMSACDAILPRPFAQHALVARVIRTEGTVSSA